MKKEKPKKPTPEEITTIMTALTSLVIADKIDKEVLQPIINGEIARLQKENTELQKEKLSLIETFTGQALQLKKENTELKEKLKRANNKLSELQQDEV